MPPDMPPLWLQGLTQEIVKIIDEGVKKITAYLLKKVLVFLQ